MALSATVGAWLGWGGLSFSNPVYYATLAVAAWCPVSKILAWRLWRRDVKTCLTCLPARSIGRHLSPLTSAWSGTAPDEQITKE